MFFYFSFLRTPPQSSLQSSSLAFTPQVTNDLRTEPFPTSVDIYYWWISSYAPGPEPQNVTTTTTTTTSRLSEPTKLTTWRQENAYKTLQIPPPLSKKLIGAGAAAAGSGSGIDCSLVLAPAPNVASSVIDLRDPEIGRVPLPVCSLPIRISISPQQQRQRQRRDGGGGGGGGGVAVGTSATKSSKQEAIIRTFRIFDEGPGLGDVQTPPLMHIKETVSFDLDKVTEFFGGRYFLGALSADDGLVIDIRNCGTAELA